MSAGLRVDDSKSYAELEASGVIDSSFYEINEIDLTKPYAMLQRPINVVDGAGKHIGLAFSSIKSAQAYIDAKTASYPGLY